MTNTKTTISTEYTLKSKVDGYTYGHGRPYKTLAAAQKRFVDLVAVAWIGQKVWIEKKFVKRTVTVLAKTSIVTSHTFKMSDVSFVDHSDPRLSYR